MLSPKQIGTICFAIFSFVFSIPSYSYVSNNDPCTDDTLSVQTGSANLVANWQGNSIALNWYETSESANPMSVAAASQNCTYGGGLTPPATIPTRTGYTFKGWRARQSGGNGGGGGGTPVVTCDVANLGSYSGICGSWAYDYWAGEYRNDDDDVAAACGLTEDNTWAVDCSNGRIFGSATCEEGSCTCQFTGYTINGGSFCSVPDSNIIYGADFSGYADPDMNYESCWSECAYYCAEHFNDDGRVYELTQGYIQ